MSKYITDAAREYVKDSLTEDEARQLLREYAHAIMSFNKLADKVAEKLGTPFFNIRGGEEAAYFASNDDFKSEQEIESWIDELIEMAKNEGYAFK